MRKHSTFTYHRDGETLRIQTRGMSTHEIREILVGCWAALPEDDKQDHIRELQHYSEESSVLSECAKAVSRNVKSTLEH